MALQRSNSLAKKLLNSNVSPCVIVARSYNRGADVPGLDASKLVVEKSSNLKPLPQMKGIAFGKHFSDHMLQVDWTNEKGWGAPKISEYGNLSISPSAMSLHYAIQCFEGMKAYKDAKGQIRLFRPDCNFERLNNSMKRLFLPQLDHDQLLKCLGELLKVDEHWIPTGDGYSLYLRPTTIAMDSVLPLQAVNECKFFIITCPVGPYYPSGFKPIKLLADDKNVRAWPGGCGNSKLGGNYAPTIAPQMAANDSGCAQVLWLYPTEDDHIVTEVGAMNLFFVLRKEDGSGDELVTAPLTDGTILPGVTRRSVLDLARQSGDYIVSERELGMKEIIKASKEGRLLEAFGAGTAAVIAPVNEIHYQGQDIKFPTGDEIGPVGQRMWNEILDIQYGRVEHPWSVIVS